MTFASALPPVQTGLGSQRKARSRALRGLRVDDQDQGQASFLLIRRLISSVALPPARQRLRVPSDTWCGVAANWVDAETETPIRPAAGVGSRRA